MVAMSMKSLTVIALFALVAAPLAAAEQCRFTLKAANVWTGSTFETRDVAVDGGVFVASLPVGVTEVPASWAFIIPPLVDAHTHTIDEAPAAGDVTHRRALDAGIFYALNPNNIRTTGATPPPRVDQVELQAAGGGITRPGGHPRPLYEMLAGRGMASGLKVDALAGRAYHEAATPAQARAAVRAVAANGSAIVKLYLLDHAGPASNGLSKPAFEAAVDEARKVRLRPIVHIETVADFRLAIAQRVAGVVHMPGYFPRADRPDEVWRITKSDADAAKAAGLIVVTTLYPAFQSSSPAELRRAQSVQAANLTLLRDASVALAAGADGYRLSVLDELTLLRATTLFDTTQLIRMATETGVRLAWPDRKLGRIAPGYEASFLLLYADPRASWFALGEPLVGLRGGKRMFDNARMLPSGCAAP